MPIRLAESVTVRSAGETHTQLQNALAAGGEILVDCSAVEEADISAVQLLIAAWRSAVTHGEVLRFDPAPSSQLVAVFERAGVRLSDVIGGGQAT